MGAINRISINGKIITVEAVYQGNKNWSADPTARNTDNHAIYVSSDEGSAEFEAWGSIMNPTCFESDDDGPYQALYLICSDALTYLYDEIREVMDPNLEYEEYEEEYARLEKALADSYYKLSEIGFDEDDILKMVNSETDYDVVEDNDGELFVPNGR